MSYTHFDFSGGEHCVRLSTLFPVPTTGTRYIPARTELELVGKHWGSQTHNGLYAVDSLNGEAVERRVDVWQYYLDAGHLYPFNPQTDAELDARGWSPVVMAGA